MKLVTLLSVLLVMGCAATKPIKHTDLFAKGTEVYGNDFFVFHIPSRGSVPDTMLIAKYKATGSSSQGEDLYGLFSRAEEQSVNVVVGGSNAKLNQMVVEQAIDLGEGEQWPGLAVHMMVAPRDSVPLASRFDAVGATFSASQRD